MEISTRPQEASFIDKGLNLIFVTPIGVLALIFLMILPLIPFFNQEYLIRWLVVACFTGALAIAFDFTAGFINIVNFGFAAVMGLGGYTSAILSVELGVSPWIGMVAGGIVSAIIGLIIGLITLRLRGIFATCLAWFVGIALMGLAIKMVWLTRGQLGLRVPHLFETSSNIPYYYLILGMMMVAYLITKLVSSSNMGLAFMAIGQNMEAARASGVNPVLYRIVNFTISCALAGWLGGFYAHYYGVLTPDLMHTSKTVEILAVAYVGGRGSLWGGAVIAFPLVFATEMVRSALAQLPGLNLILYGLLLIGVMIYYPGGFASFFNTHLRELQNKTLKYIMNGR